LVVYIIYISDAQTNNNKAIGIYTYLSKLLPSLSKMIMKITLRSAKKSALGPYQNSDGSRVLSSNAKK